MDTDDILWIGVIFCALLHFTVLAALAWLYTTPAQPMLENTSYLFIEQSELDTLMRAGGKTDFSYSGAASMNADGSYVVRISNSCLLINSVMLHENCHVRQFMSGRSLSPSQREDECNWAQAMREGVR
jgi:hypothetical protein